jgi:hypothetical protein
MGECQVCDDIWQMFADPGNAKREIVVGSFEQALASPCPKHTPILESFRDYVGGSCSSTDVGFRNPRLSTFGGHPSGVLLLESVSKNKIWQKTFEMLLVKKGDVTDHPGTARILDAEWVDLEMLKYWVAQCSRLHLSCATVMNTIPTVPALLVDVKRRCIVSGVSGCRYVALSYRCGKAAHFRLDRARLDELRQEFALDTPDILRSLPSTIRHAISLTKALGERYLWTDSLCITHEDPSALAKQLEQMAAIYSSALFTVVATDGDGTSGILGLPGFQIQENLCNRSLNLEARALS